MEICGRCKWWQKKSSEKGQCRQRPPTTGILGNTHWPTTKYRDGCGQFSPEFQFPQPPSITINPPILEVIRSGEGYNLIAASLFPGRVREQRKPAVFPDLHVVQIKIFAWLVVVPVGAKPLDRTQEVHYERVPKTIRLIPLQFPNTKIATNYNSAIEYLGERRAGKRTVEGIVLPNEDRVIKFHPPTFQTLSDAQGCTRKQFLADALEYLIEEEKDEGNDPL